MRRRHFLQAVAGSAAGAVGAAAVGMPLVSAASPVRPDLDAFAHPDVLQRIGAHRLIREIGDGYRKAYARENDADLLAGAILPQEKTPPNVAELLSILDRQIRSDFEHGRTVRVRGWILSRTEARQCALYSILYP